MRLGTLFWAASLALAPAAHAAGDADAGKTKAQACAACHGPTGNESVDPTYPRIAGQYADYLEKALRDYKSGARKNAIMAGFATTLSEDDIADLSAYYAEQPGQLEDLSHLK
ncbi:MAG TPA: cytochrome c [Candidatus Saccharimonadia bacterium]|nr:cytochrome c [Candidatus Saccharimonadia bacterium]